MNGVFLNPLLLKIWFSTGKRLIHCTGVVCAGRGATHYETLKLDKDCSTKEIKEAFIKLSKQHHPDVNNTSKSHAEFQKIQEAYSVLSKPHLRSSYDFEIGLFNRARRSSARTVHSSADPFINNPWADPSFYQNRDKSKDSFRSEDSYYGIKGIKRQPNSVIALVCVMVAGVVFTLEMIFIRYTLQSRREYLNRKSMEAEEALKEVRDRANANGNQLQLEILKWKYEQMEKSDR